MDHARAADNNAFEEVLLTIAATLDAWRARPDRPAARHEVFDEIGERLERIDLRRIGGALAHQIYAAATQKNGNLEAGCNAAVGDGEADLRKLVIGSVGDQANQVPRVVGHWSVSLLR